MNPKQRAAEAALTLIRSNTVVGLGTGSTAEFFLRGLGDALKEGRLQNIRGVATSKQSEKLATDFGIPVIDLSQAPRPDITVDGADEVAPDLNLIKGLGGALLREKIVAQNSARLVIIADTGKAVQTLGTHSPLPVEVTPFAHETHVAFFKSLGADPKLRKTKDGSAVFVTDNGNYIYDCRFENIPDPAGLEMTLRRRAGVVESGLFIGIAKLALIADENSVREIKH